MARFKNTFSTINQRKGRPQAELLTIGTELVSGTVVNTNAAYLGLELTKLGFSVQWQSSCRDESHAIKAALRLALSRSDVIFVSGGLGPTPDDITRKTLAELFHVPLIFSKSQYRIISRYYQKRDRVVPTIVRQEASLPANAVPLINHFGIAMGFKIEEQGRVIIVMPGVPNEMAGIFETRAKPFLLKKFPKLRPMAKLTVKTLGLSEPSIMKHLSSTFFKLGDFQFGIYPEAGEVSLRIYANSHKVMSRLKRHVDRVLGEHIYSFSDDRIETVIGQILRSRRWRISVAESCTGGKVADAITGVSGASDYFAGAVVGYQKEIKTSILGVPSSLLKSMGAVSREVALAMAKGIRERFGTTLGVAVSGIAGPTGGTAKKPIGLVYVAVASSKKSQVWEEHFVGDRRQIQTRAAKKVLEHLWQWLRRH